MVECISMEVELASNTEQTTPAQTYMMDRVRELGEVKGMKLGYKCTDQRQFPIKINTHQYLPTTHISTLIH
jgi:hypothetical protein